MLIHELTADECAELLRTAELARLACAHDGQPYIVPIHFSFDSERNCLYAFSSLGMKVEWMRDNPRVCVEVEDIADKNHWRTVLVFGRYEEIRDVPQEAESRRRALDLFGQRGDWWFPAAGKVSAREPAAVVVYRIQIERVTGRRAARTR